MLGLFLREKDEKSVIKKSSHPQNHHGEVLDPGVECFSHRAKSRILCTWKRGLGSQFHYGSRLKIWGGRDQARIDVKNLTLEVAMSENRSARSDV